MLLDKGVFINFGHLKLDEARCTPES